MKKISMNQMEDHPTSIDSEFVDYERYLIDR